MAEHDFTINFKVNNQETKAARQEEAQGYQAVEQAATASIQRIGKARDDVARKATENVRQLLTEEQALAKAKESLIDQTNRKAVKAAMEQLDATKKAAAAQVQAAKEATDQTQRWASAGESVLSQVRGLVGMAGGITSLAGAVGAVAAKYEDMARQARQAAEDTLRMRGELKELAGLGGKPFVDADTLKSQLGFRSKTLQSATDASRLQESALGMAGAVVGPGQKLSQDEFQTLLVAAGQLQVSRNIDPTAMGQIAGTLAFNAKPGTDGETLKRQLLAQFKTADLGNLTPSTFADQFAKAAPTVGAGDFSSMGEMGAVLSGMSFSGRDVAGERIRQLVRMTRGSLNDVSKPAGADISPGEYLKSIGATDQVDTRRILEMMSGDVDRQKAALPKGQTLALDTYLRKRGYGSVEDINAFKAYYSNRDVINQKLLPAANQLPTADQVNQQLGAFRLTPSGFAQQAELSKDVSTVTQGVGAPEYLLSYKRDLFERLKTRDAGSWMGWGGQFEGSQTAWNAPSFHKEMIEDLRAKGTAVGLDWAPKLVSTGMGEAVEDPLAGTSSPEQFGQLFTQILAKGGSVAGSPETKAALDRQIDLASKMEKHLAQIANRLGNAPPAQAFGPGGNMINGRLP